MGKGLRVAGAMSALLAGACITSSSEAPLVGIPTPCGPECCVTPGSDPPPTTLVLENRTARRVDVVLRAAPMLRLDARVVDGTLSVSVPDATFGPEVRVTLDDRQTANLSNEIEIASLVSEMQLQKKTGGVIRIGDGPSFIALGVGTVVIRLGTDGEPLLEPEDPKLTTFFRRSDRSRSAPLESSMRPSAMCRRSCSTTKTWRRWRR
jgi:hypothetical protein